jgi:membrane protease YdiL (CAAX protease family)
MARSSKKKSLLTFFLLVFALSIPLWIVETIVEVKGLPLDIPVTDLLAAFTPLISACILVYKDEGHIGVKKLLKRAFDFSSIRQKMWYVLIIFLPLLMFLVIFGVMHLLGLPFPRELPIPLLSVPLLFIFFFLGAAGEEVGYMGYAVDPMQERLGALKTGIIMGLVWAMWHYPSIVQQGHNLKWIAWGTLGTVAFRFLIIWLYNNTGKSLFACILFHTLYNVGRTLFPRDEINNPLVEYPEIHYSIIAIIAFIMICLSTPRMVTYDRNSL